MRISKRHLVTMALWLCVAFTRQALAGDAIYVAKDESGVPHFSSQPYDNSYSLYLRAQPTLTGAKSKPSNTQSSIAVRRAAMAPYIQKVAAQHGIDPALLSAVAEIESGFNANAVSPKGAIGTMQLIPTTAADYGVTNPYDAQQNLDGGARYLKDLLAAHNGNLPLALAAYNAGKRNVNRHNQRIPPFNETMLYVPRVLAKMAEYQRTAATQTQ